MPPNLLSHAALNMECCLSMQAHQNMLSVAARRTEEGRAIYVSRKEWSCSFLSSKNQSLNLQNRLFILQSFRVSFVIMFLPSTSPSSAYKNNGKIIPTILFPRLNPSPTTVAFTLQSRKLNAPPVIILVPYPLCFLSQ